jgi:PilZ domain
MPALLDRRVSPRWVAVKNQSVLELQGADGRRRVKVTLVDVSRDGALVVADEPPPLRGPLWLRMEDPAKTDWVRVEPVRRDDSGRLGLRFVHPCPDDFLLAAMLGVDLVLTILDGGRPPTLDDVGYPA